MVSKENIIHYEMYVPQELGFLLHGDEYVVLGLTDEDGSLASAAGVCILSFGIPDAVMMEWFFIEDVYRGHDYGSLFFDAAADIARQNGRSRVMARLWGKKIRAAADYLSALGFAPASTDRTDTLYYISDLKSSSTLAIEGHGAHKAGFELREVAKGVYIPMLFGNPSPERLKKAIASALYDTAIREGDSDAVLYLRCYPWEPLAIISEFFIKGNSIRSVCFEASIDTPELFARSAEEERSGGENLLREIESIPTWLVMTGLEEY